MYSRPVNDSHWKDHVKTINHKTTPAYRFEYQGNCLENKMGYEEMEYFCGKLKKSKVLKSINLDNNDIDDSGLFQLAKVLKKNHSVTSISLKQNPKITPEGIKKFLATIQSKNSTLTEIVFDHADSSLDAFLDQNKTIQMANSTVNAQSPRMSRWNLFHDQTSPSQSPKLNRAKSPKGTRTNVASPKLRRAKSPQPHSYRDGFESTQFSQMIILGLSADAKKLLMHRGAIKYKKDEYKDSRIIGAGTFAKVYTGEFKDEKVAVKVIKLKDKYKNLKGEDSVKLISSEIEILVKLAKGEHEGKKNIISLWAVCMTDIKDLDRPLILVFEFASQGSLDKFLQKACEQARMNGEKPKAAWDVLFKFVQDVANGLAYMHENQIVHCDIKPANILLTEQGAKIADFGISVDTTNRVHELSCGTDGYIPPQGPIVDPKWDVYSFGVTINDMGWLASTGSSAVKPTPKKVIEGDRPAISEDCPALMEDLIKECWEQDADKRLSSKAVAEKVSAKQRFFKGDSAPQQTSSEQVEEEVKRATNG